MVGMSKKLLENLYKDLMKAEGFEESLLQLDLIKRLSIYKELIDVTSKTFLEKIYYLCRLFRVVICSRNFKTTDNIIENISRKKVGENAITLKSGIYVWGDTGRGKSMLLNLFFDTLETKHKLRMHFHNFMLTFHEQFNSSDLEDTKHTDLIKIFARKTCKKYKIIYLDELQVNNIADAMILGRLFSEILSCGTFLFITSNFHPQDLFLNGLQRDRFIPFIDLMISKLSIYHLMGENDYRMIHNRRINSLYIYPLINSKNHINKIIHMLFYNDGLQNHIENIGIKVSKLNIDSNRSLDIKVYHNQNSITLAAYFEFFALCQKELGARDYIVICQSFRYIVLANVIQMDDSYRNEVLRFITFIDCAYEQKNILICAADVEIGQLYVGKQYNI